MSKIFSQIAESMIEREAVEKIGNSITNLTHNDYIKNIRMFSESTDLQIDTENFDDIKNKIKELRYK